MESVGFSDTVLDDDCVKCGSSGSYVVEGRTMCGLCKEGHSVVTSISDITFSGVETGRIRYKNGNTYAQVYVPKLRFSRWIPSLLLEAI